MPFALVLLAGACSSSDEDAGADFVGSWSTTTGVQTVKDCQFSAQHENVAITYTVAKGSGADVKLQSSVDPSCELLANVVEKRALVVAGQTCVRTEGSFKDTYTFATTSVMDLTVDGAPSVKLDATFKRATTDGTDTGYECGYTEESPIKKN